MSAEDMFNVSILILLDVPINLCGPKSCSASILVLLDRSISMQYQHYVSSCICLRPRSAENIAAKNVINAPSYITIRIPLMKELDIIFGKNAFPNMTFAFFVGNEFITSGGRFVFIGL